MSRVFSNPRYQPVDVNGDVLPGSKLYFYYSQTTTLAVIYTDADLTIPATNPVIADSNGRFPEIYLDTMQYKIVLYDANDVQQYESDPVSGTELSNVVENITERFVAAPGQTVINLTNEYTPGSNDLEVHVNGVLQTAPQNYTEVTSTSFVFTSALGGADIVVAKIYKKIIFAISGDASDITFNQDETGSIDTLVDNVLKETTSVKRFGAVGNGVTDDKTAIENAIKTGKVVYFPAGTYYIGSSIYLDNNAEIFIEGEHRDLVTIIAGSGVIPFFNPSTIGSSTTTNKFSISGITFDGEWDVTGQSFPYRGKGTSNMFQAFNLRAANGENDAEVTIRDCRFKDINNLPIRVYGFRGKVEFTNNHVIKCWDPGIIFCHDVIVNDNLIEWGSDNGFSVSRSNNGVVITGNIIRDVENNGIYCSGFSFSGAGNATISGSSYNAGDNLTLTFANSILNSEMVDYHFLLRSGSDRAFVQVISVTDVNNALVKTIDSVPGSLQATPTADWEYGPFTGSGNFAIANNIITGSYGDGIDISGGTSYGTINGNSIRHPGAIADREVYTSCSLALGSTDVLVGSSAGFSIGDFVEIRPHLTNQDIFIDEIADVPDGTHITLTNASPETYAGEPLYLAHINSGPYGIELRGVFENSFLEHTSDISVVGNTILDAQLGGIQVGDTDSNFGACRRIRVSNNLIDWKLEGHVAGNIVGVNLLDKDATMRNNQCEVTDNLIRFPVGFGSSIGIKATPIDGSGDSYVRINGNTIYNAGTDIQVIDVGATDRKGLWLTNTVTMPNRNSLLSTTNLSFENWTTATESSGTLTVNASLNVISPGSDLTIDAIDFDNIPTNDRALIVIRNGSSSFTLTFEDNANIRTLKDADVIVPAHSSISFIPVTTGIVQQVAGSSYTADTLEYTSGQLLLADGTAAQPVISFTDEAGTNTGIYRVSENKLGFSAAGGLRLQLDSTATLSKQQFQGQNGTVGVPTYSFESDTDTGIYKGTSSLSFAFGGVDILELGQSATSTLFGAIELNGLGSGDRTSYIDWHSDDTNSDFSFRIIRDAGVDGLATLDQRGAGSIVFKTNAGNTALEIDSTQNSNFNNHEASQVVLVDYAEKSQSASSSSGTLTLDYSTGNYFYVTLTENITTITINNWPASGSVGALTLEFTQNASTPYTISYPGSFLWSGGTSHTMSAGLSAIDIVELSTRDAGTTIFGFISGQDMS